MLIGVPKEIKTNENRIALVPAGAEALAAAGTRLVEKGAGLGSGFPDEAYAAVGRRDPGHRGRGLAPGRDDHEGEGADRGGVAPDAAGAGDLHLLPLRRRRGAHHGGDRVRARSRSPTRRCSCPSGELPLLTPMSEVAGRMAVQEGAKYLEKVFGGSGMLLGGVPGVAPGRSGDHRRRRGRHQRGQDGRGPRRPRHHPRHLARPAALPRRRAAGQRGHRLLQPAQHPRRHPAGRPGHRRGAAARAPRRPTWSSGPTSSR